MPPGQEAQPGGAPTPPPGPARGGGATGIRTRTVTSLAELDALGPAWRRFPSDGVQGDFAHFRESCAREDGAPHVIVACEDGTPRALLAGRIRAAEFPCRIGRFVALRPRARTLEIVEGGVLGAIDERTSPALYEALRETLAAGRADVVHLRRLHRETPLYDVLRRRPPVLLRDWAPHEEQRFIAPLPDSLDTFIAQRHRSTRRDIRRRESRLRKEFGERMEVRHYQRPEDPDRVVDLMDAVFAETYQARIGVGYADVPRDELRAGLARGEIEAFVLFLDGAPAAFELGSRYRNTFECWTSGYRERFATFGLGMQTMVRMIDTLCRDPEIDRIDFGSYDTPFKWSFCDERRPEASICLYAPSLRAIWVNTARTLTRHIDALARAAISRLGLTSRVRRLLRRQ